MCGLVGYICYDSLGFCKDNMDAFTNMLIVDSVRGSDGTGMLSIQENGRRSGLKMSGNPYELMQQKGWKDLTNISSKPYKRIMAGHNRYATFGIPSTQNSHPFYHKHISLMHNGTLTNYTKLPKPTEKGKDFVVDSDAFAYSVSEWGIEDTVAHIDGAYAVAFYNGKDKTFHLARNPQRPLFLSVSEKEKEIMWASEKEMLEWVQKRNNLSDDFKTFEIAPNTLYTFPINKLDITTSSLPFTGSKNTSSNLFVQNFDYESSVYDANFQDASYTIPLTTVSDVDLKKTPRNLKSVESSQKIERINSINSKPDGAGKSKCYKPEMGIRFVPYDLKILDASKERYQLTGKRNDFDGHVKIKCNITGKITSEILVEEQIVTATIKNIIRTNAGKNSESITIWVDGVTMEADSGTTLLH